MRWLAASAKAFLVLLVAGVLVFGSARAANTIVTAMVCAPGTGSQITLVQPVTDSTVNSANIAVSGRAVQATNLAVSVDGVLRQSIDLASLDTNFNTTVTVSEGTHEIKVEAADICNVNNDIAMAIVTYIKAAVPSQGTTVPTATQPSAHADQAVVSVDSVFNSDLSHDPLKEPVSYGDNLVHGVIDESQPAEPVNSTPVIIAIPFVVGAGAFGWVHFRRFGH